MIIAIASSVFNIIITIIINIIISFCAVHFYSIVTPTFGRSGFVECGETGWFLHNTTAKLFCWTYICPCIVHPLTWKYANIMTAVLKEHKNSRSARFKSNVLTMQGDWSKLNGSWHSKSLRNSKFVTVCWRLYCFTAAQITQVGWPIWWFE